MSRETAETGRRSMGTPYATPTIPRATAEFTIYPRTFNEARKITNAFCGAAVCSARARAKRAQNGCGNNSVRVAALTCRKDAVCNV